MKHVINFIAPINEYYIGQLIHIALQAITNKDNPATELEIRLSSLGGNLHAGFTAYNFFRTIQIPIHMHNIGNVESVAVILFLVADKRTVCKNSRFLLHNLNWTYPAGTYEHCKLSENSISLDFDLERYVNIFEDRTNTAESPINVREALAGRATHIASAPAAYAAGITTIPTAWDAETSAKDLNWWITSTTN